MHTLEIKTEDNRQGIAVFWVIKSIRYGNLKYEKFITWNVKVNCKPSILDGIRNFEKTKSPQSKK